MPGLPDAPKPLRTAMTPLLQPLAVRPRRPAIRRLHVIKVGGALISNPAFLQRLGPYVGGLVAGGQHLVTVEAADLEGNRSRCDVELVPPR